MMKEPFCSKEQMSIVVVGHVDHGKSTIIGRLLADTGSLPEGKLTQVKLNCQKNSKPFEYAFLIDALKDEQAQGITIDSARVFFKTVLRDYIIIDAPGHIEFLKNMITGASRAESALLVIDAHEGVRENSRRHGYMLSLLGIKKIAVIVNKMDLVSYEEGIYQNIVREYSAFLSQISMSPEAFIPVSGMSGDNIVERSGNMPWYAGKTILQTLDAFEKEKPSTEKPFRMPVQDVYKFTKFRDSRRIVAGTIDAGTIGVGDEIVFYPSGKKSRVRSIEAFNTSPRQSISAGYAAGLTLSEQIFITRGEIACRMNELKPCITSRMKVSLFWLGKEPMVMGKEYILKLGTVKMMMRLEDILHVMDSSSLNPITIKDMIERNDVAECIFVSKKAIAFDLVANMAQTGRFVIVDNFEISGGGIILEGLEDKQSWVREKLYRREYKWETGNISRHQRSEKYHQNPFVLLITGKRDVGKKPFAKNLEKQLFKNGKMPYFLGIGNVLYGVDADIKGDGNNRQEHLRRLAEVAHILVDAGIILIVTATELNQEDLDLIRTIVNPCDIKVIWVGEKVTSDIACDLYIPVIDNLDTVTANVLQYVDTYCHGVKLSPLKNNELKVFPVRSVKY